MKQNEKRLDPRTDGESRFVKGMFSFEPAVWKRLWWYINVGFRKLT